MLDEFTFRAELPETPQIPKGASRDTIFRFPREYQAQKRKLLKAIARRHFVHKPIKVVIRRIAKPSIPKMPEANNEFREAWNRLTASGASQIKADKMSKVKKPKELEGLNPEDFERWYEDLDIMFQEGGVTEEDAQIYLAMRYLQYELRKTMEDVSSSRGFSYDKFIKDLKRELGVKDSMQGSTARLENILKQFKPIKLNVDEARLRTYVRYFKREAEKLRKEPALLSNITLVLKFLSAFDARFHERIVDHLECKRGDKYEANQEDSRRIDDPYTLDEVMQTAISICTSKVGALYGQLPRVSFNDVKAEEVDEDYGRHAPTPAPAILKRESIKTEPRDDEWGLKISSSVDKHSVDIAEIKEMTRTLSNAVQESIKRQERVDIEHKALWNLVTAGNQLATARAPTYSQARPLTPSSSTMGMASKPGTAMVGQPLRRECFMCKKPDHFINDCPAQAKFRELKWLKEGPEGGRLVMYDGSRLPSLAPGDTRSRKEIIEEIAVRRKWPGSEGYHPDSYLFDIDEVPTQEFEDLAIDSEEEEDDRAIKVAQAWALIAEEKARRSTRQAASLGSNN